MSNTIWIAKANPSSRDHEILVFNSTKFLIQITKIIKIKKKTRSTVLLNV